MEPAERIVRGVMIEFGNRPDRAPACVRVAILTRNGQRAVRTPGSLLLRGCRRSKNHPQDEQNDRMPPHRHRQFAAPNFLGFVQPGPRVGKPNGSRQNTARASSQTRDSLRGPSPCSPKEAITNSRYRAHSTPGRWPAWAARLNPARPDGKSSACWSSCRNWSVAPSIWCQPL